MIKVRAVAAIAAMGLILAMSSTAGPRANAAGPTAVSLGNAQTFAVLAAAGVTNAHAAGTNTVINGNVGTHPTASVTGFPPGTVNGTIHAADATALSARTALQAAYIDARDRTPFTAHLAALGAGEVLLPGIYRAPPGGFGIGGTLTLNGGGDPTSVFIFQIPEGPNTLTTAAASQVLLTNGQQACNVFWQVGSSATFGASSIFAGNVLAHTSISLGQSVTVNGRLLAGAVADSGAVTLIDDNVTLANCVAVQAPTPTPEPGVPTAAPSPSPSPSASPSPSPLATPSPLVVVAPTASAAPAAPVAVGPAAGVPASGAAPGTLQRLPSTSTTSDHRATAIGVLLAGIGALLLLRRPRRVPVERIKR